MALLEDKRRKRTLAPPSWWSLAPAELLARMKSGDAGLDDGEAERRLAAHGPNELVEHELVSRWRTLWAQVKSPLLLLLVFAAAASMATGEWIDATIVVVILAASTGIGYSREYSAQSAAAALRARVQARATVVRAGKERTIPAREVVPGDIVVLSAGSLVPADEVILDATDFFVNEAVLTGESFPVEKKAGPSPATASTAQRNGCVFLGTNVRSGTARVLVVETGPGTVNDAPAMHAADTSISVDDAVDVAREAADFVLLERHLDVIRAGTEEGRRTFANTLKYVLTTTSANLGNMVSMAVASIFLPFLPLTAGQILLNNFLSDIPAIGIAGDSVDKELVDRPRRWDLAFIRRFMIELGLLSSLFDLITFALLLRVFDAPEELFRTGWFVESLLTELVIALVVRTRRPFFKSRPGRFLFVSSLVLMAVTFAIPFAPGAHVLGFVPLPLGPSLALVGLTALYLGAAEGLKAHFYAGAR